MLGRNLIANVLGQGWSALMGFAFIPWYIRYLGIEAYGLVGLYATLVAVLAVIDTGISPAVNRSMARFTGGAMDAEEIRDLLRSFEFLACVAVISVSIGVWSVSAAVATGWLKPESVPVETVADAIALMGLVASLRLMEGMYRGALAGLHRQIPLNAILALSATLRGAGVLAILAWISPSIQAFFLWQAVIAAGTVLVLALATYRNLPTASRSARFSWSGLRTVARFSASLMGMVCFALLLTQMDKILLARLLPLDEFARYALASTVASTLVALGAPITQAWFPRLSQLHAQGDTPAIAAVFHAGSQLMGVLLASAGLLLVFFPAEAIFAWSGDRDLATGVAGLLSLLAFGTVLNGLLWIPNQTQLAFGWTSLSLTLNIAASVVLAPAIMFATIRYGAAGAAIAWIVLNAICVPLSAWLMFRRILRSERWRWLARDAVGPLLAGGTLLIAFRATVPWPDDRMSITLMLVVMGTLAGVSAMVACPALRSGIPAIVRFLRPGD